jgi:4-amino-4-deoxy-L-arabinose transferase-like glycosyltransferase
MEKQKKIIFGLLLAILVAGFALRFANIENIPFSIYPDEAQNGVDAQQANATGQYKLFYESNNGREGLFINIQAISIKYLGSNTFALKLPSIIFGTLTILGVFLLTYELLQSYVAGLIGAYLIAFSYWAINFSRIGFRAIMVPFILTFAFYFTFRGLRTRKLSDFIIAGFIYGLGLHTYIAFRVSPLVLIALFVSLLITRKRFLAEYWKHLLVFAVTMFIASAPMLLDFFVWHPEHYTSRTSEISILNPDVNQGHLFTTFLKTFGLSLAKYNFWGDQNWRQNYPPYPILNPLTGIAFLAGLVYIFGKFFHLVYVRFEKGARNKKLDVYVFLLAWFFTLLIPEFLAAEGNPHALRSIGTLPVVMIIAVIPFMWIIKRYHAYGHAFKFFIFSILLFTFLFIGIADPIKYFVFFANNPKQHQAFEANLKEVSNYIQTLPKSEEKYIVTGSMQRLTIKFLNQALPNTFYKYPEEAGSISPKNMKNFIIIFTDADWKIINAQRNRFPDILFEEHRNFFGDTFYVLKYQS